MMCNCYKVTLCRNINLHIGYLEVTIPMQYTESGKNRGPIGGRQLIFAPWHYSWFIWPCYTSITLLYINHLYSYSLCGNTCRQIYGKPSACIRHEASSIMLLLACISGSSACWTWRPVVYIYYSSVKSTLHCSPMIKWTRHGWSRRYGLIKRLRRKFGFKSAICSLCNIKGPLSNNHETMVHN